MNGEGIADGSASSRSELEAIRSVTHDQLDGMVHADEECASRTISAGSGDDRPRRCSVEGMLDGRLDAEADRLRDPDRHERIEARRDTRAGSHRHRLQGRMARGRRSIEGGGVHPWTETRNG